MKRYEDENIYTVISENAALDPSKLFMAVEEERTTNAEFITGAERIASSLNVLGVTPGTKIALIIPNSVLWYKIFWGIVKIGAVPVPFDPQIGEWEMERLLDLADIEYCFAGSRYRANDIMGNLTKASEQLPRLKRIIACEDDLSFENFLALSYGPETFTTHLPEEESSLMLACTSGSTGNPKIIVVPHRGFGRSQRDMGEYLGFCETDVMLLGMPLYHQGGFGMGLQMVLAGGTVMYQPTFDPVKFLETVEREKITVLQLTSTLAKIILSVPDFDAYDFSLVRIAYFAGEMLPIEIARTFFEKLGVRVINVIGSTETATMVVWDSDEDVDCDSNEFRPLAFTDAMVLDQDKRSVNTGETGTIFIHTDALLIEYFKNEAESRSRIVRMQGKKWFDTQDLGVLLPDGRIRFAGRAKRIIKRGSNLVCPEENEAFLLTHPDIAAVAVVGEKHELLGEAIVAYVQCRQGVKLTRSDVTKFCMGRLAAYKIPDKIIFTDSIPHDIGKVQFKYLDTKQKE
jgi:acyl-CoA synthetase (AMP-forming)/AMP-acid ligase II